LSYWYSRCDLQFPLNESREDEAQVNTDLLNIKILCTYLWGETDLWCSFSLVDVKTDITAPCNILLGLVGNQAKIALIS